MCDKTMIRNVLEDITPLVAPNTIKMLCEEDESMEDLMEPCPQELWMSRTPSFWDEDAIDEDYDWHSDEVEVAEDFAEVMSILTSNESSSNSSSRSLINETVSDVVSDTDFNIVETDDLIMDEEGDEELSSLLHGSEKENDNEQLFGNDAFVTPISSDDSSEILKTPAPLRENAVQGSSAVAPPRPARRPAPISIALSSEDEKSNDDEAATKEDAPLMMNDPPSVERLNRSVHFWDEVLPTKETNKGDKENTNVVVPSLSQAVVPSPQRRRSRSPSSSESLTILPPATLLPSSIPLLTLIPTPSFKRIPVRHTYQVVTEEEEVKAEEEMEDHEEEGYENFANEDTDICVDFDSSPELVIDQLRQSAGTIKRTQAQSHFDLAAALNLFRDSSLSTKASFFKNTERDVEDDTDCNTEAAVAESMTSTIAGDEDDENSIESNIENEKVQEAENAITVKKHSEQNKLQISNSSTLSRRIHVSTHRRVSMLEVREWKENEWITNDVMTKIQNHHEQEIKNSDGNKKTIGTFPIINKHTVLKEASHIVPPRRQTIHIAMAA